MGHKFEIFSINSFKTQNRHTIWKITKLGKFYLPTSIDHQGQTAGVNRILQVTG